MSVGSKIKSIRKKRGMSQKDLAENIISRGMLSRIENETAFPSMQTLSLLAKRLEVSPAFILEDGEDIMPAERARILKIVEDDFSKKDYLNCTELLIASSLHNDKDFSLYFVISAFETAKKYFYAGEFGKAKLLLDMVITILPSITVPTVVTLRRVNSIYSIINNICRLNEDLDFCPEMPDFEFSPSLFIFLLKLLKQGRHDDCKMLLSVCSLDNVYREYISAQIDIKDYKFIDAIIRMKALSQKEDCPAFLKLLCYSTIETCCKICEDYKGAYDNHLVYQNYLEQLNK